MSHSGGGALLFLSYGVNKWFKLFNPRQLLILVKLVKLIRGAGERIEEEKLREGWCKKDAFKYAKAIITYSGYDGKIYAFIGRNKYSGDYEPPDGVYSVFARYDPNSDTWENLTFPPWPGTDDGASLAWAGGKYIYALEGEFYENTPVTNFAGYDIDNDAWENMSDIPAPDGVGDGGSLLWIGYFDSSHSDPIFALDGNGCNETPGYNFTVYHISTDTWEELEDLPYPVGYYVGNRLAYARGKIFYWQGTPSTWEGGGRHVCYYVPEAIPEMVFAQIPDFRAIPNFSFVYLRKQRMHDFVSYSAAGVEGISDFKAHLQGGLFSLGQQIMAVTGPRREGKTYFML